MDIVSLQKQLDEFAQARDWEQFHSPKNLSMALAGEAAEILEIFQWLSEEQSRNLTNDTHRHAAVAEEIADVMIYLLRLADKVDVDIDRAVQDKINKNAEKYPVQLSRGNATKYNQRDR